jgi:hypothetical protein
VVRLDPATRRAVVGHGQAKKQLLTENRTP